MLEIVKTRKGFTGLKKAFRNFRTYQRVGSAASTKIIFQRF